ncbi:efflux RND transporter periplasmic adaptor subunit [Acuticoccus sp. MNP-M23]|uniref:efflux RND transporter periplasmic adaptor subunit n=1 Tax=Acuticoccus sp. MNP-M23 TaxID=3072793 RepID=UPI0028159AAA|nr:efflux RND transporter periplasmic adaptor subunit [Acuticoccus sp. MNP-M23]WMS41895.1 efflux RND transporter periplasmic adaptor subunit [Acuticoccus sp. MNP-M23]
MSSADNASVQDDDNEHKSRGGLLWLLAALVVLALGAGVFYLLSSGGEEGEAPERTAILVRAATVRTAETLTLRQTAFVRPRREVAVTTEVSGRIAEVGENFALGKAIARGDLLIRLESESFEADVARADAAVTQAEAQLAQANVDRDRQAELESRDFASEAALQQAIVAVAAAEGDLAAARANLTQAEIARDDTVVRAPFDALVTAEDASEGALVQAGTEVGRLVGSDAVEILMGLTPGDLAVLGDPTVALGGRIVVRSTAPGNVIAEGIVTEVNPRIEADTRTVSLVVEVSEPFAGPGRTLRIDELVILELPVSLENRAAVEVPPEAIKGRAMVWRIEDGALRRTMVTVLDRFEDRVVLAGDALSPGASVMVSDLVAPFDGKEVRVEDENAEPASRDASERGG